MNHEGRLTEGIAHYVERTGYEDLPEEAVASTKRSILDTLGILFPATTLAPASDVVHDLYAQIDGGGPCTLIGYGEKASLLAAAMVNGSLAHAMDFDDFSGIDKPLVHPTANCLPAALALAEQLGHVSGKDLVAAVALGNDVGIRMCACVNGSAMHDYEFFPQTVFGVFQATVAAGKLLGLSAGQMTDALGLAVNRVSGFHASLFSCEFRSIRDSFGNEEGIRCALLASRGFAGCKDALEVLYRVVYHDNVDTSHVTEGLGEEFYAVKLVGYKPWPSCQSTQPYAQAVIEAMERDGVAADDIEHVQLVGCRNGADAFFPKEQKSRPSTGITAKTALPYVAAVAALRQNLVLTDFVDGALADPAVQAMARRIDFEVDEAMPLNSGIARIRTKDGAVHERRVDVLRGNVQSPLGEAELLAKFKSNASLARRPLSTETVDALARAVLWLEDVEDVSSLMESLNRDAPLPLARQKA